MKGTDVKRKGRDFFSRAYSQTGKNPYRYWLDSADYYQKINEMMIWLKSGNI